jgi:hypothetical protein
LGLFTRSIYLAGMFGILAAGSAQTLEADGRFSVLASRGGDGLSALGL